jgi:hypothetical protein
LTTTSLYSFCLFLGSKKGNRFFSVKVAGVSPLNPGISGINELGLPAAHVLTAAIQLNQDSGFVHPVEGDWQPNSVVEQGHPFFPSIM